MKNYSQYLETRFRILFIVNYSFFIKNGGTCTKARRWRFATIV